MLRRNHIATREWKIGDLARETGLSVRTLHHYDEIGLLMPSRRSEAGYRLYATDDIARLQHIKSLRQLGLSLGEIRDLLDRNHISPLQAIEHHLHRLEEQMALQRQLIERLRALVWKLSAAEEVSAAEFIKTIEVMTMLEDIGRYYTEEQMDELRRRRNRVGEERIRQVEAEWPPLIAEMRAAMERNADPTCEEVQVLARRWDALVQEFTGGNPGIERSLQTMYQHEPAAREFSGIDADLFAYVTRALSAR